MIVTQQNGEGFRLITRPGSVRWSVKCRQARSTWLTLIITKQVAQPGGKIPSKCCQRCHDRYPCVAFLKSSKVLDTGYRLWSDSTLCPRCSPPDPLPLPVDAHGYLRLSCEMREANGSPVRLWDRSTHSWLRPATLGLRRMTGSDDVRLQPYTVRRPSVKGYGANDTIL
jgi:hypothetical protein